MDIATDQHREILLGYCFVIFGIISALNSQMVLWNFGWFGRGGAGFSSMLANPTFDNIEVWYFLAGLIFFVVHILFMGLFMYSYINEKIYTGSRKRTVLEVFYLSWVGSFSVIALHAPRILLTHIARIDPEYEFQKEFLQKVHHMNMTDWTVGVVDTTQRVYDLANYGIVVIISYFAILFFLHYLRHWKIKEESAV